MSTVEKIGTNKIKLNFSVTPERFQEGLKRSYNKNKNKITIPGFRKGKAPRKVIERTYGKDFFYDEAVNFALPDAYEAALDETGIIPVSKPTIQLESVSEEDGAMVSAEVFTKPEVTIDGYYGLTYPPMETEPTDADIMARLDIERNKNARLLSVERPAIEGDILTINFEGFLNGVPFEGGKGDSYELTLGSHTFIDNFEEQLIGSSVGDDVEVYVTFPEDYNHETMQGQSVLFKVEVLDIRMREMPELDDEFAQDISEFDTMAEYRSYLAEKIREEKVETAENAKRSHILAQLVSLADMEVPEVMYTDETEYMIENLKRRLEQQGLTLPLYLTFSQMTMETLREQYTQTARETIDGALVLEAIVKKEALELSEEEFDAQLEDMAQSRHVDVEDLRARLRPDRLEEIRYNILNQKALELVLEKAVAAQAQGE